MYGYIRRDLSTGCRRCNSLYGLNRMNCKKCEYFVWCEMVDGWSVLTREDSSKRDKDHCYHYLRELENTTLYKGDRQRNPCPLLKKVNKK